MSEQGTGLHDRKDLPTVHSDFRVSGRRLLV